MEAIERPTSPHVSTLDSEIFGNRFASIYCYQLYMNERYGIQPGVDSSNPGQHFWNHITPSPKVNPVVCTTCKKDTENFNKGSKPLFLFERESMQCCRHCYWYGWFYHIRKQGSSTPSHKNLNRAGRN